MAIFHSEIEALGRASVVQKCGSSELILLHVS